MVSLDSETSGLDLRHSARPFFVTVCDDSGEQRYWEWSVDPLTREVEVPDEDLREIGDYLFADGPNGPIGDYTTPDGGLILQNPKFDFTALSSVNFWEVSGYSMEEAWPAVRDTLLAGHLLSSNTPHDLTSMGVSYLGVNIEHFEADLGKAVNEARRIARSKYKDWLIAKDGMGGLPSVKGDKAWKNDMWLPRAIAKAEVYLPDHPWWTVLSDYANADSAITLPLWKVQKKLIESRKLGAIYRERLKLLPISYRIEDRGVTVSGSELQRLKAEYSEDAEKSARVCVSLAESDGYELDLGKGTNNSLRDYCFGPLGLEPIRGKKAKTTNPSLDKDVMAHYLVTLPPRSKQAAFVNNLLAMRSRRTAVSYMEAYERFWIPLENDDGFDGEGSAADDRRNNDLDTGRVFGKGIKGCTREVGGVAGGASLDSPHWFRLHPSLNMTGTDTLRWSSKNPNEQNISKKEGFNLRACFGPAPGREWWSCDAKNIELRLPAYAAGEDEMIALFERPDDPPYYGSNHLLSFETVYPDVWQKELVELELKLGSFGDAIKAVGPHCKKKYASTYYQWVKNGNFAIQYGAVCKADGNGTADRAFHRPHSHIKLRDRFTKINALNRKCIDMANRLGYVETMPDKTVDPLRGYPLRCTRMENGRALETVPLSYFIQGTAMQWTNKAMIRTDGQLEDWRRKGFDGFITIQAHDELVFDFPKRANPKTDPKRSNLGRVKILQKLAEQGGVDIGIPTPTSCEYHDVSWSEGVSL